jgi:hypothetical protein
MAIVSKALASGAVGAGVLTLIHQMARTRVPRAPRMDVVGMRAVDHVADWLGTRLLPRHQLYRVALAGDMVANSLYYSMVVGNTPAETWRRGLMLGAMAGVGAVSLPERIGLGAPPDSGSRSNQLMTIAWYLFGGLAAAAAANAFRGNRRLALGSAGT